MSNNYKRDFPLFQKYPELVYLDSAATSQKPQMVIDAVTDFYTKKNANIHRGIYKLAEEATAVYEQTRDLVADFIHAGSRNEIIFTGNTNQSINLVAEGWARKFLKRGDVVVISEMEHHANLVPWQRLRDEIGIELVYIPVDSEGRLDLSSLESHNKQNERDAGRASMTNLDTTSIKLLALSHVSNVLGTVNPIEEIIIQFKKHNPELKVLVDAAQSIAHFPIDVQALGCDFLAFSSHKMFGPAGVGVLWAKEALLEEMEPLFVGSHMIKKVTKESSTYASLPDKFEVGTGNLEGVAGFGAAIQYIQHVGFETIQAHDAALTSYALKKLLTLPYLKLHGPKISKDRIGIFSFEILGIHPHDVAQVLDSHNVAVRAGHHCSQVLMQRLGVPATARASLSLYNTNEDIDKLIDGIEKVRKTFLA